MSYGSSDWCSSDLYLALAEGDDIFGRLGRLGGGAEDSAAVLAQDGEPKAEVIGVAHGRDQAEGRADEGGRNLRDQFFARILRRPVTTPHVAGEPRLAPAPLP